MVARPTPRMDIIQAPWARSLELDQIPESGTTATHPVNQTQDTVLFGIAIEMPDVGSGAADTRR